MIPTQLMKNRPDFNLGWPGFSALILALATTIHAQEWQNLFDGGSLAGWTQRGGKARYSAEDNCIVGRTVHNTPNSFLCTEKDYANFILELEFKVDPQLNSGVQIRSHSLESYRNGRVHGYQVEIDPSGRAWSGGIYDESRRGWLDDLKDNEPARKAFRQNDWNRFRIEAIGDRIKTWINGVPAADLHDALTPGGFIALQVHGIPKDKPEGIEVRWRNIRIKDLGPARPLPLFNGRNLDGWTSRDGSPVTAGWEAVDGTLHRASKGGDLYTDLVYGDFDFQFEWKISEAGNSGVKYRMTSYGQAYLGPEYQILDDDKHPDGQKREGRRRAAALYDLFRCNDSKSLNPVGAWNASRIVARGSRIEHWLNGKKVLDYDTSSDKFKEAVAGSKFAKHEKFAQNPWGRIMLQDHNDEVWYRNLTLKPLSP